MKPDDASDVGRRFVPWYGMTNMTGRDGRTVRRWQEALGRVISTDPGGPPAPDDLAAAGAAMREIASCLARESWRPMKAAILHGSPDEGELVVGRYALIALLLIWLPAKLVLGRSSEVLNNLEVVGVFVMPLVGAGLAVRGARAYRRSARRVLDHRCLACGYMLEARAGAVTWCSECGCANLPRVGAE